MRGTQPIKPLSTVKPCDNLSHGERVGGFPVAGRAALLTDLAVVALPAVAADALVNADFVDAGASVAARVALAVVYVCFVVRTEERCELDRGVSGQTQSAACVSTV